MAMLGIHKHARTVGATAKRHFIAVTVSGVEERAFPELNNQWIDAGENALGAQGGRLPRRRGRTKLLRRLAPAEDVKSWPARS